MKCAWMIASILANAEAKANKPHLIYMLADDFGYYDVSWKNPTANTPNMDQLVAEGLELNRFYTYKFCSPTRSSFLSGRLPLRVNVDNNPTSKPGGVDVRMSLISRKLKAMGYATSTSGKWHGGGYLEGQLPHRKGFDRSLVFLNGNEDHYTRYFGILKGYDFWQDEANKVDDFGDSGTYSNYLYAQHAVDAIDAFDPSKNDALFMYVAWQVTHSPYEVPDVYRDPRIATAANKQTYYGMATAMDEGIGNITKALKAKGMWDDTLIVFSADNGGEQTGAGNNYPLRGGKYTDFEGGTRNVAFASGGWLPAEVRGHSSNELIHICDMWATFASLAGDKEPTRDHAAEAWDEVPVPDSIDVSAVLRKKHGKSHRTEIPLSTTALIVGRHKIVTEKADNKNFWAGPEWPAYDSNNTKTPKELGGECKPCIFDIFADPNERNDLSGTDLGVQLQANLSARLKEIKATTFSTADADFKGNFSKCITNDAYMAAHGGFVGPLCTEESASRKDFSVLV